MSLEKQFPTTIKVNKDSALIHDSETMTDGLTTDYLSTWRTKCPSSKVPDLPKSHPELTMWDNDKFYLFENLITLY